MWEGLETGAINTRTLSKLSGEIFRALAGCAEGVSETC